MHPTPTAYAVPFAVDRTHAPHRYDLVNISDEPIDGLSLTHLGTGYCPPLVVRHLDPGRSIGIAVFGASLEETGVVIVRCTEYLWRMSLAQSGLAP